MQDPGFYPAQEKSRKNEQKEQPQPKPTQPSCWSTAPIHIWKHTLGLLYLWFFFFNNFETLTTFLPLPISLFNPCFWVSSMAAYIEAWSVRCCVFSLILAGFLREGKFHLTLGIQNWHQLLKNIISDMASSHTTGSTHFWFWFLLLFLRGSYVSQTGQNLLYSWG